ncbi:hypothetical protein [Pseudoduganella violacea]|uniref:Putative membrane protein YgcG n=1 Tax=Pseudoduganella violacea TaxID=1715466 RepID=A0A7W5B621_9BURK|nr:hypothetical protein [Pseudoduganella violacea]MBB3117241.1 putative membrane protein YgcG [Pseudoduganella violacea]
MGKFLVYAMVVTIFSMSASWIRMFSGDEGTHGGSGSSWSSRTGGGSWGGGGGGGHK